jgi:hypothetical protein
MYPASSALKQAVRTDHIAVSRAEIWSGDRKVQDLEVSSGKVTISSDSSARRTCTVSLFADRDRNNIVPDNDFDSLTPFGNELRLYRGVEFSDGSREFVPLGIFVITDVDITDTNEGVVIKVDGIDRSLIVSRAKWTKPYQMVTGSLEDSITALLKDRYPDVVTAFPTTNVSINQVILGTEKDNNPWKDAVEICELVGYDLFFDAEGIVEMKLFPSIDGAVVVASYDEGQDTAITTLNRTISTRETYNGVIYTIEGSEVAEPKRIEVWDENTTSPTYRYGTFGEVPIFVETSILATEEEAIIAATNLLNFYIGAQETISWESIVDPTLDVQDVVYVQTEGAKVDRLVIIDVLDIPLEANLPMTVSSRTVRVVSAEETIVVGS